MPVRAQLGCAAVRLHGFDGTAHQFVLRVFNPVFAQLQVDVVAFFEVEDLVGHTGQGHGIAGQKVLAVRYAHAQNQRRTGACAHDAVRLVFVEHRQRVRAA